VLLERNFEYRGGLRSSLDTGDLTVLPIYKQAHYYSKLVNFVFTERMQLNHLMDILPQQLQNKSEIERDIFLANEKDVARAFLFFLIVISRLTDTLLFILLRGTWLATLIILCSSILLCRLISLLRRIFTVGFNSRRIRLFLERSPSLLLIPTRLLDVDCFDGFVSFLSIRLGRDTLTGGPRELGSSCDLNRFSLAHRLV